MRKNGSPQTAQAGQTRYVWYKELTRYHWFVLTVASLGWLFDTAAQQLFNLARTPAIRDLLHVRPGDLSMDAVVKKIPRELVAAPRSGVPKPSPEEAEAAVRPKSLGTA